MCQVPVTLDDIFPPIEELVPPRRASDAELYGLAVEANERIQRIQHLARRERREAAKLRFPRGYLREAGRWRVALGFLRSNRLRNNVAYALMLHDVQAWLLHRTDLAGHARDMLVKGAVATLGSVAEAIAVDATTPPMGRRQRVASRVTYLRTESVIDETLKDDLLWLWETRNRQHLHELTVTEFDFYTPDDHPRAEAAVARLIVALQRRAASVAV